jgi:LytS/YehU family sensor histidine kinase
MIWVACFPNMPWNPKHATYWHRFAFHANAELISNMVIFWGAFGLFRGVTYYQKYRDRESAAEKLKTELVNSQMRALRMQLNPHFLFNTMNSISSLMHTDVAAADDMLEQLSSLLRITLKRGEVQLIPLSEEMEFIEMYLAMQDRRFTGRVTQEISVEPDLHDALVPAMLLQPIIENAYTHGLSKLNKDGRLVVKASRHHKRLKITVTNSGTGLKHAPTRDNPRQGVGIANVQDRLRLHYGSDQSISLVQLQTGDVEARITLPLQLSNQPTINIAGDSAP